MSYRPDGWENEWDIEREFDGMLSMHEIYEAGASALLEALIKKGIRTNSFRTNGRPIYLSNPRKNGVYVFIPEDKK